MHTYLIGDTSMVYITAVGSRGFIQHHKILNPGVFIPREVGVGQFSTKHLPHETISRSTQIHRRQAIDSERKNKYYISKYYVYACRLNSSSSILTETLH